MEVLMRRARSGDADAINYIFNQAIQDGNANLDIDEKQREYRLHWLAAHDKRHPVYVGEVQGEVVCWVALSPYSSRYPYDFVADLSIYVRRDLRGQGLGSLLLKFIEQQATQLGYYKIVLSVYGSNRAALHAYRRAGYRDVGVFRNHGYHKGKLVDIIFMERLLTPDMEFLKEYYQNQYPFYDTFFREERAAEEALLRRNGMLPPLEGEEVSDEEFEEVPVQDALPEGIVRFLKSKKKPPAVTPPPAPAHPAEPTPAPAEPAPPAAPREQAAPAAEAEAPGDPMPEVREAEEVPEVPAPAPAPEEEPIPQPPQPEKAAEQPPAAEKPKRRRQPPKTSKAKKEKQPPEDPDAPLEGQLNLEDVLLTR